MSGKRKLIVSVTGASGAIYARILLERLQNMEEQISSLGVIFSSNARAVWNFEIGGVFQPETPLVTQFAYDDLFAPVSSGSSDFDTMIICPCSMGTLGRIAAGVSDDLITRAADVMLKERRKLILVPRETPYNLLHLRNMIRLTEAGTIICPATPSFYSKPDSIEMVALTVVERIISLAGLESSHYRWGSSGD